MVCRFIVVDLLGMEDKKHGSDFLNQMRSIMIMQKYFDYTPPGTAFISWEFGNNPFIKPSQKDIEEEKKRIQQN